MVGASEVTVPDWEPRTVADDVVVEAAPLEAFQALVDDNLSSVESGDTLPPLWHWLALSRWSPSASLGGDGHPRRGSFLPPIELPRRIFAGGEVTVHAPIVVGSVLRRTARVTSVNHKSGRTGPLVVVTVCTTLHDRGNLCLEERQSLIYRGGPATSRSAGPPAPTQGQPAAPLSPAGDRLWSLQTDPSLLMRFSAATANAHRIHYDWPYATAVEGYPGLVVHGPLMTLLLVQVARLAGVLPAQGRFTHRNVAPLFCGEPAHLRLTESPDGPVTHTADLISGSAETVHTTLTMTSSVREGLSYE